MNGLRSLENLLADELLMQQRNGARSQIKDMMQDTSGSIAEQNEQQLAAGAQQAVRPKLEARMMKERQDQARMQNAMRQVAAGLPKVSAPNMARMADGGIVGYAEGGTPTPGAVSPKAVDPQEIKQLADLYRQVQASMDAATDPAAKAAVQQRLNDLKTQMGDQLPFVMQYLDSTKGIVEPRTKMAEGGVVGFKEGDYVGGITGPMGIFAPGINKGIGFADFLAQKGVESLTGLSAAAVNRLRQEYEAMQAREMDRPRGDSVSESQMENLSGVLGGAGNVLREGIASPPSAGEREATEAQRESRRRGPGAMLEGIASLAPKGESDLQKELRDAERRMRNEGLELADMGDAPGAGGAPQARRAPSAADSPQAQARIGGLSDFLRGMGNENFFEDLSETFNEASRAVLPKSSEYAEVPLEDLAPYLERLGAFVSDVKGFPGRVYDEAAGIVGPAVEDFSRGFTGEGPTQQTDAEVAEEIIATAPSTEDADAAAMKGVPQIANPSLRAAMEGTQDAPAPAPTQEAEIETVTSAASAVTQNPTPENTSRFESEIERLMERRESPVRALSDFLAAFSQARGGSMGQNLAIATTAMRKADDALDNRIIELEKLRRADQISERDFGLKQEQLTVERSYRDAMAAYYQRMPEVQKEVELLRQAGKDKEADRRLREAAVNAVLPYRMMFTTMAEEELPRGSSPAQIKAKADELFKEQVDMYTNIARGPQNAGAANFGDQFAGTMTVTP